MKTIYKLLILFFALLSSQNTYSHNNESINDSPEHVRVKSDRNKSSYHLELPSMEVAPASVYTHEQLNHRNYFPGNFDNPHDAESKRIQIRSVSKIHINKNNVHEHNSLEFIDKKNTAPESKIENFSKENKHENIVSEPKENFQSRNNFISENEESRNLVPLDEGLVITRDHNNVSAVFNSDGYIPNSNKPNIINYRTYRNMGLLLDFDSGSSKGYIYSWYSGYLGFEINVKDYIVGGNITLIRNMNNRVYIYEDTGYVGWMNNIVEYTVGQNLAILKSESQVYIYSHSDGLIDTLNITNSATFIKAGDHIAVVLPTSTHIAYIYNTIGLIGSRSNINDYDVGGNMAIVRSSNGSAYVYSDLGYQGYENNILDYDAGGELSILRNTSNTTFTYKYNGFLYSDANVIDYEAGGTLAGVLKNNNISYIYKLSGYYVDVNTLDFAVGGAMAVVRLLNTTGTNAYTYSDLQQVSSDVSCTDFKAGGNMATTKVSLGNFHVYSLRDYLGTTYTGIIMAPGGNMTITKSSTGVVSVWNKKGIIESFTEQVLDFIAGGNMSVVRVAASLNYTAYIYKSTSGYLGQQPNVKDYSVAGLYANSGGTVGIVNGNILIPEKFTLSQNYPNPFNPKTNIKFETKTTGIVKLKVYDILGKEISTLINEELISGVYETYFDGSNFTSGVYFYVLESAEYKEVKKMVLLK